jgi:hypothetical protein
MITSNYSQKIVALTCCWFEYKTCYPFSESLDQAFRSGRFETPVRLRDKPGDTIIKARCEFLLGESAD